MTGNIHFPSCYHYHAIVCIGVHVCVCWRPEVDTICLLQSLPYVLRKDFSVNLKLTGSARPAGQDTPVTLVSASLQLGTPAIPPTSKGSSLPIEPSLQLPSFILCLMALFPWNSACLRKGWFPNFNNGPLYQGYTAVVEIFV